MSTAPVALRDPADRPAAIRGTDDTPGARRLHAAFARAARERRIALVPYVVAGYPDASTSLAAALGAIDGGADVLEVGLPYSDPLADGTTLQRASAVALRHGADLDRSLDLLAAIHAARPATPLVPMAYVNQAIGSGDPAARLGRLAAAGASGVILADLTPDEGAPVEAAAREAGLALIYLVTPTTPPTRRASIAATTGGFLYTVSLVGVTGARSRLPRDVTQFLGQVRAVATGPVAVGFGVSRPAHVRRLARVADGVIVASALVDALGPDGRDVDRMARLVRRLAGATARP
jgi:tryptophan synthase alpha chain